MSANRFVDQVLVEVDAAEEYADLMHEKAFTKWNGRAGVYSWLSAAFKAGIEWEQTREKKNENPELLK